MKKQKSENKAFLKQQIKKMKMKNQEQKTKIILEKYYGKNRRREGKKRAVFHDGPAKSYLT